MTQPNLLHPVPVQVQSLDKANTMYDEHTREPIQQASHSVTKTVQGQPRWGVAAGLEMSNNGPQENAAGYVLFRHVDLDAAELTLKENDRFIKIGNQEVDVYIVSLRYEGHYSDAGGSTLVKAFFRDRQPSRQRLGQ